MTVLLEYIYLYLWYAKISNYQGSGMPIHSVLRAATTVKMKVKGQTKKIR